MVEKFARKGICQLKTEICGTEQVLGVLNACIDIFIQEHNKISNSISPKEGQIAIDPQNEKGISMSSGPIQSIHKIAKYRTKKVEQPDLTHIAPWQNPSTQSRAFFQQI